MNRKIIGNFGSFSRSWRGSPKTIFLSHIFPTILNTISVLTIPGHFSVSRTVRSDELILRGAGNNKAKVDIVKLNKEDDELFDMMNMDFEYPVVTGQATPTTVPHGVSNPSTTITTGIREALKTDVVSSNKNSSTTTRDAPEESLETVQQTNTNMEQIMSNMTGNRFEHTATANLSVNGSQKLEPSEIYVRDNQVFRSIKKRSLTTKKYLNSILNKTKSTVENPQRNTTERTYNQFKSLLVKRLSKKAVTSKVTQKYTFKTKKIPVRRKLLFKSDVNMSNNKMSKAKTMKSKTQLTSKQKDILCTQSKLSEK